MKHVDDNPLKETDCKFVTLCKIKTGFLLQIIGMLIRLMLQGPLK